ncbi:MAG: EAL domain-containing protein [Pantoea sp.]|uniref:EAL domain-containing protein n=1 Tax=Pantoea sp. TaxID=69393 RepID=UPI0039E27B84
MFKRQLYDKKHLYRFIAEPIINREGGVIGFEVLTRFSSAGTPAYHMSRMSILAKKNFLLHQLQCIDEKRDFFRNKSLLCTVNADFDMASFLISESEIKLIMMRNPFIRIEISENFPDLDGGIQTPILRELYRYYKLWIDDFGSGFSNLKAIQDSIYEFIKIDKEYFWRNYDNPTWNIVLRDISMICRYIIVEGVEREDYLNGLPDIVFGIQGHFFDSVSLDEIEKTDFREFIYRMKIAEGKASKIM